MTIDQAPKARRRGAARLTPLSVIAALTGAVAYLLVVNPDLIHGNLVEAARHHLNALLTVPFLLYALVVWTARSVFGLVLPMYRPGWKFYTAYAVVFLTYSVVLRNLPWAPFDWFYVPYLQP